jgi:hypothetical protein
LQRVFVYPFASTKYKRCNKDENAKHARPANNDSANYATRATIVNNNTCNTTTFKASNNITITYLKLQERAKHVNHKKNKTCKTLALFSTSTTSTNMFNMNTNATNANTCNHLRNMQQTTTHTKCEGLYSIEHSSS